MDNELKAFGGLSYDIPAGESRVIDLRAASSFVVWAASGTPTQQAWAGANEASGELPGAVAENLTVAVQNDRVSHWTRVTAPAGEAVTVCVI